MHLGDGNGTNLEWYEKARFGLFIHWGLYAATEGYWNGKETQGIGEWIVSREKIPMEEYEKFTDKLTCDKFNPSKWAELAKNAGMGYCVFTAKHHEGYSMFDTSFDDYSIVKRSPYGRDVALEVTEAMRKEGIVPCFYYSHALDFHEPNAMGNTWDFQTPEKERDFTSYIEGKCKHQLRELLTNYGPIGLVWMDVPKGITEERALEIKAYVKSFQPHCLVSGRVHYQAGFGDFGCFGDNQIPAGKPDGAWETAATMNGTWGYKRDDHNFKSVKEILELLCGCLSKGVNLLLNIGPKADGDLPEESITILEELAKWHKVNGEAVNATSASPFPGEFSFGAASCRENIIYLYLYDEVEEININGLANKVIGARVLGGRELTFTQEESLHLNICKEDYGEYVTVVRIELDGAAVVKEGLFQQEKDVITLSASRCEIIKNEEIASGGLLEGDSAIEAENLNLAEADEMSINPAGIVVRWFSEKNCLSWKFTMEQEGEYDVYLYSLTRKYKEWMGGHRVHVESNTLTENSSRTESKVITADRKSRGANGKYFGETGSLLGSVSLRSGENVLTLIADKINSEDIVGLSVSKIVLEKKI